MIIGGWIGIVLIIALLCRNKFPEQKELTRKIVHIGTGPVILLAWWLDIPSQIAISFAFLITISLLINHSTNLLPGIEDVNRTSYGTVAYGASITLLLYLFWSENPAAVSAGVLMMAFGDGLAGLVGRQFTSPSWKIMGQKKSIIGTFTMAFVGALVLISISMASNASINIESIIVITSLAVFLEQFGPWGIDNLTVPICVGYAWNSFHCL